MNNQLESLTQEQQEVLIWYLLDVLNCEYANLNPSSPKYQVLQARTVLNNIDEILEGKSNSSLNIYFTDYGKEKSYTELCERQRKIREIVRQQINK